MVKKILLVEGETDKELFSKLLSDFKIKDVEIWPPKLGGSEGNGVNNLIDCLNMSLKQVQAGKYSHIGVVVDADYETEHGYRSRRKLILDALSDHGFQHNKSPGQVIRKGEIAQNQRFACRCGFWIMPDHCSDGMAESLLRSGIVAEQQKLLNIASEQVQRLEKPLFSKNHLDKVVLATWLAWQKWAGMPLHKAIEREFIDTSLESFDPLKSWLFELYDKKA